jgi:putative NADH-flavin reductase
VPKKTEQEYFMSDKTKTKSVVAIIGSTGYTGHFIIAELLRRGMTPIAIARDANALSAANFPENEAASS